jgi:hypothetical protein
MKRHTENQEYVRGLATLCRGGTMSVPRLAGCLNEAGLLTRAGAPYQGLRGTYTLVGSTWKWLHAQGLDDEAENVAEVFVKPNGGHAWN